METLRLSEAVGQGWFDVTFPGAFARWSSIVEVEGKIVRVFC